MAIVLYYCRISGWLDKPKKATSAFLQMGALLGNKPVNEEVVAGQDSRTPLVSNTVVKDTGRKDSVHPNCDFVMSPQVLSALSSLLTAVSFEMGSLRELRHRMSGSLEIFFI